MRWLERWFGVLAGALGLIALALSLSQQTMHVTQSSTVTYGPGYGANSMLTVAAPVALAAVASLLACFAAVRDSSFASPRGMWTWLVIGAAVLCGAGVYLLAANSVWVTVGGVGSISAALLFFPATLAAIISMFTALRPRAARA